MKTIMLSLIGTREQVAYAATNRTLRELFDPEEAVVKFMRQMEMPIKPNKDSA